MFKDSTKTDLICLIEYDGEHHYRCNPDWGGDDTLLAVQRRDAIKTNFCEGKGIRLIRIPYWDKNRIEDILTKELCNG